MSLPTTDPAFDDLLALVDETPTRPRKLTLDEMRASMVSARTSDKRTWVSSKQHESSTSDNPRPSREYEEGQDTSALVANLISARDARGQRKAMRRPFRRRGQRELFDVVRLHLKRLARRVLNDRCRDGLEPPTEGLLAAALERYLRDQCWHLLYIQDYGEVREPGRVRRTYLDGERAVESVARVSARYALATWTPDYIREMQERGRRGGKTSKRGPMWTDADLDKLAALAGQTVAEQSATLGVSMSTIDRMRRALRARST
ncbi:hypothetical protein ABXJ56_12430 [Microbacterium chocolatum]|uniref:hypothetical protein n=1 Tax=Microbacterium aurantiacum TaxID=162393 RepID=UPI00338D4516